MIWEDIPNGWWSVITERENDLWREEGRSDEVAGKSDRGNDTVHKEESKSASEAITNESAEENNRQHGYKPAPNLNFSTNSSPYSNNNPNKVIIKITLPISVGLFSVSGMEFSTNEGVIKGGTEAADAEQHLALQALWAIQHCGEGMLSGGVSEVDSCSNSSGGSSSNCSVIEQSCTISSSNSNSNPKLYPNLSLNCNPIPTCELGEGSPSQEPEASPIDLIRFRISIVSDNPYPNPNTDYVFDTDPSPNTNSNCKPNCNPNTITNHDTNDNLGSSTTPNPKRSRTSPIETITPTHVGRISIGTITAYSSMGMLQPPIEAVLPYLPVGGEAIILIPPMCDFKFNPKPASDPKIYEGEQDEVNECCRVKGGRESEDEIENESELENKGEKKRRIRVKVELIERIRHYDRASMKKVKPHLFYPSLAVQRRTLLASFLRCSGATSWLDVGCGDCSMLEAIITRDTHSNDCSDSDGINNTNNTNDTANKTTTTTTTNTATNNDNDSEKRNNDPNINLTDLSIQVPLLRHIGGLEFNTAPLKVAKKRIIEQLRNEINQIQSGVRTMVRNGDKNGDPNEFFNEGAQIGVYNNFEKKRQLESISLWHGSILTEGAYKGMEWESDAIRTLSSCSDSSNSNINNNISSNSNINNNTNTTVITDAPINITNLRAFHPTTLTNPKWQSISCIEVIEHLPSEKAASLALKTILKNFQPKSALFSTPNYESNRAIRAAVRGLPYQYQPQESNINLDSNPDQSPDHSNPDHNSDHNPNHNPDLDKHFKPIHANSSSSILREPYRETDHKFEFTRKEFQDWAYRGIREAGGGYEVQFTELGCRLPGMRNSSGDGESGKDRGGCGGATQVAIFRIISHTNHCNDGVCGQDEIMSHICGDKDKNDTTEDDRTKNDENDEDDGNNNDNNNNGGSDSKSDNVSGNYGNKKETSLFWRWKSSP
jgi:hypothetical protein